MVALQAGTNSQPPNGPRPINLRRDIPQIVDLLELVFNQQLRSANRQQTSPTLGGQPLMWRFLRRRNTVPGFVWEEGNRIVGNVSLLTTDIKGRYLVANVAVHPDFRRRGIAHNLMKETIKWTAAHQAHAVLLQVEEANTGAVKLYKALGFQHIDTVQLWESPFSSLRNLPVNGSARSPDHYDGFAIRPLQKNEWEPAYQLDVTQFHPDLNWPEPLKSDVYRFSFSNWWDNFMLGRQVEVWVVADKQDKLVALGSIESEWARPHKFKLRIVPEWQGQAERPLLAKLIRRVRYLRRRPIQIEHPSHDYHTLALLQESGLHLRRTLMTMRLDLKG